MRVMHYLAPVKAFRVYRSSAGSGKTYRLVLTYLTLALSTGNKERWQHILAITFTNKAANEMKTRILEGLKNIADWKAGTTKPAMFDDLLDASGLTPQELSDTSGEVLKDILHHYDRFAVSTIDKFTHRLVRSFAHELKMPQDFEVVIDKDDMLDRIVQMAYTDLGSDKNLTKVMKQYTLFKVDIGQKCDLDEELKTFCGQLFTEEGQINMRQNRGISTDDYLGINKKLWDLTTSFEEACTETGNKIISIIDNSGLTKDDFAGKSRSKVFSFSSYLIKTAHYSKFYNNREALIAFLEDDWVHSKSSAETQQVIENIKPEICALFEEAIALFENKYGKYLLAGLIRKNIYGQALLGRFREYLDQIIHETGMIHISEFNRNIAEHIALEPAAFIYEVLGARYEHILFDEFQDTSLLQWYNIIPMLNNGLSEAKLSLVVGDGKQAIYRFRNGRVEQLIDLPHITDNGAFEIPTDYGSSLLTQYHHDALNTNRRSTREIINFNNELFGILKQKLGHYYRNIYDGHKEHEFRKETGYVHIQGLPKEDFYEFALERLFEIISECIEDGYAYGDILILTRTNDEAELIATFLLEAEIDFTSKESLRIARVAGIRLIISILKLVNNQNDQGAVLEVLRSAGELGLLTVNEDERIQCLEKPDLLWEKLQEQIPESGAGLNNMSAYEAIEYLASAFGFYNNPSAYILGLLDFAHDVSTAVGQDILSFLSEWEKKKDKTFVAMPARDDAVRIMTIHQSKGLEEKIVIAPFCNRAPRGRSTMWFKPGGDEADWGSFYISVNEKFMPIISPETADISEQLMNLDYLNVLYVAFTRPRNRLYACVPLVDDDKQSNTMLVEALLQMEKWDVQKGFYEDGSRVNVKEQKKEAGTSYFNQLPYKDWKTSIRLKTTGNHKNRFTDYGKLLHHLLSMMKHSNDLEAVILEAKQSGSATPDDLEQASEELRKLFAHQDFVNLFDAPGEVLNEAELLTVDAAVLRPDRVVNGTGQVLILDYKTGHKESHHAEQVRKYAQILGEIVGSDKDVIGYLVYTRDASVQQVC